MERDLDIFMELSHSYRKRKRKPRQYPAYFHAHPVSTPQSS